MRRLRRLHASLTSIYPDTTYGSFTGADPLVCARPAADHIHGQPRRTEALAAAGGLPLIHPVAQESLAHLLKGWDVQKEPVFLNATDSAGESRTTGLRQWFEADHWVALDDPIAIKLWRTWFRSIRKGHEPSISQK